MDKKNRVKARDRRSTEHVKVFDAAQLIAMAEHCTAPLRFPRAPTEERHAARVARNMLDVWRDSQVVLRADDEFLDALLSSDTDVPLVPDWLARLPFPAVAVSLPSPLSLHDGHTLCHYTGFLAAGIRHDQPSESDMTVWTRYGPLTEGDGIRFLWLYTADRDPTSRCQTVTVSLRGELAQPDRTLADLITTQRSTAEKNGQPWGDELPTLVPLSVQTLLYLTAQEPDLDWPAPEQITRPHQLRTARVAHLGWRVGSALRTWRHQQATRTARTDTAAGPGRALPPHIRRAHWHRVRIATRDHSGRVIGSTTGTQGIDWDYQLRWYPPTPVNTDGDSPPPAVRQIAPARPSTRPESRR